MNKPNIDYYRFAMILTPSNASNMLFLNRSGISPCFIFQLGYGI